MSAAARTFLCSVARSSRTAAGSAGQPSQRVRARGIHRVNHLKYPVEGGVGDFLSPDALKTIAVDYQTGLLERLNDLVKDTTMSGQSVIQTVISSAQDRNQAMTFNYSSQALNNSFFLENLKPPTEEFATSREAQISSELGLTIRDEFGSLGQLKSNFSAAALGMIGTGWVWLVQDVGRLAVMATYGSGTVLIRSRTQRGHRSSAVIGENLKSYTLKSFTANNPTSSPSTSSPLSSSSSRPRTTPPSPTDLRSLSTSPFDANITAEQLNPRKNMLLHGEAISPLFCISVHEHAWLQDYGVWGKEEYLKRFWSVLDWESISSSFEKNKH